MASMRRLLLAAVLLLLAPGLAGAAAGAPRPEPEPVGDTSRFERATVVAGLSMIVERPAERLVAEQDTTYTIGVNNSGGDPETVTVRVTLPPWLPEARPLDGGELGDGFVDWPVTVAPGEVTMMRLSGAYESPERDAPTRVAFTACALGAEDDQPIVCATDIARLESAPPASGLGWPAVAVTTAAAVATGGGLLLLLHRLRSGPGARARRGAAPGPPVTPAGP
jgi:hypothetical protein